VPAAQVALGAHGTASTFSTRSERSDIQTIERALKISLIRQTVPSNIAAEVRPVDRNAGARDNDVVSTAPPAPGAVAIPSANAFTGSTRDARNAGAKRGQQRHGQ